MSMIFRREHDVEVFRRRTHGFLATDPVRHTLQLSTLAAVAAQRYDAYPLAAAESGDGRVHGLVVHTPAAGGPGRVLGRLGHRDAGRRPAVAGRRRGPVGHVGRPRSRPVLRPVAAHDRSDARGRDDRAAVPDRPPDPPRPTTGAASPAADSDLDWLMAAHQGFLTEASVPGGRGVRRSAIETMVADGQTWLWWSEGSAACYVSRRPVLAGSARIGPVYTVPEHRGRGYASNLTAHVARLIFREQAVPVLFTDLANPTSNSVYAALGFVPVADAPLIRLLSR